MFLPSRVYLDSTTLVASDCSSGNQFSNLSVFPGIRHLGGGECNITLINL